MLDLITRFKSLPDGVRGIVYKYLHHDNAIIIKEAIKNNKMKLKYLKSHTIKHAYFVSEPMRWMIDREFLQDYTHIISLALLELRPSNLKQKTYGEGVIERTNFSIGEMVRLRQLRLL